MDSFFIPEDHAKGLSTFTVMAGLGGSIGYFLGALDWESTFLGKNQSTSGLKLSIHFNFQFVYFLNLFFVQFIS